MKRQEHEKTLHYDQLSRQKLAVQFETLKNKVREQQAQTESELEKLVRQRENELEEIQKDIKRVSSYQGLMTGDLIHEEGGINKDMEVIKGYLK